MPFSWQCPLKFPPTASTEIFLNFCHKTEENKFLKQRVDNCGAAIAVQRPRIRQMTKLHRGAVYNKRIFHSSLSQNWTEIPGRKNPPLPTPHVGGGKDSVVISHHLDERERGGYNGRGERESGYLYTARMDRQKMREIDRYWFGFSLQPLKK